MRRSARARASRSQPRAVGLSSSSSTRLPGIVGAPVAASSRDASARVRCGSVEGGRQRRGHLVRPEGGESDRAGRVKAAVDHGGDRESRAAHPGRDAREPDRIHLRGHVERRAFVEHGARVDHALGKAERREPRADRRAAPDRTQANGEEIEPDEAADPRQTREIAVRQVRVEESERPGARPDDRDPLLDGGDGVGTRGLRDTGQAERLRASGGELRESVPAPGPRGASGRAPRRRSPGPGSDRAVPRPRRT